VTGARQPESLEAKPALRPPPGRRRGYNQQGADLPEDEGGEDVAKGKSMRKEKKKPKQKK